MRLSWPFQYLHDNSVQVLGWLSLVLALMASIHVLLYKRNARSATAWIGLIWLSPLIGALLYPLFGINRVRRRAMALRPGSRASSDVLFVGAQAKTVVPQESDSAERMLHFGGRLTGLSAVPGNQVEPLWGGDEAYPEMLQAIAEADRSITLSTYIFDRDPTGMRFADALGAAVQRGIQVRVLIDDIGARYSLVPVDWTLRKLGVRTARFLPVFSMRSMHLMNLRLHRKLLVVDGRMAFTGGMNIRHGNLQAATTRRRIRDVHFKITGPVVADLQEVFAEDWGFTTGESLEGDVWFPPLTPTGDAFCRTIADGPDSHIDTTRLLLEGVIANATHSLLIVTPYFVPDPIITAALIVAALRGVRVRVLLPLNNNLPWCHWAMQANLYDLVRHGVEIYFSPGDFDHSKMCVVDRQWALVGSSNWDERSLRLNFELNLECVDPKFVDHLTQRIDERLRHAKRVGMEYLLRLPVLVRIRDGVARLFGPYL